MLLVKIHAELHEMNALLRRFVLADNDGGNGRKSTDKNIQQLSIAFEILKRDPSHNISEAARKAFKPGGGYASANSLRNALARKWQNYMRTPM